MHCTCVCETFKKLLSQNCEISPIKMGPVITRNKYKVGCSILSPQANNFQNFEKLHDESTFREASVPNRVSTLLSPRCFWSLSLLGHFLRIRQNSGEVFAGEICCPCCPGRYLTNKHIFVDLRTVLLENYEKSIIPMKAIFPNKIKNIATGETS